MIKIQHILHPTDFSDHSEAALKYACSLAIQYAASLHLIHVVQDIRFALPVGGGLPADFYINQVRSSTEQLTEYPAKIVNHSGTIERNVVEGPPAVEITNYAKDNNIDLIVMGTHGYAGIEHVLMGSVAENVVRRAHCPVLTVPLKK